MSDSGGGLPLVDLGTTEPEEIEWAIEGWIPFRKLTLIAGVPEVGKTYVALDLVGRLANGKSPFDQLEMRFDRPKWKVLILSAEDGIEDTIIKRLDALGHDRANISAVDVTRMAGGLDLSKSTGQNLLKATIDKSGADVVLLDPLFGFIGGINTNLAGPACQVTGPLTRIAAETRVALIDITHFNKNNEVGVPIHRISGSQDWAGAARVALTVVEDRDDADIKYLIPIKMNIAKKPLPMAFSITPEGRIEWLGAVDHDPKLLLANEISAGISSPRTRAVMYLKRALGTEPLSASDIQDEAREMGFSRATLQRAKTELGVVTERENVTGGEPGQGKWLWRLAKDPQADNRPGRSRLVK